VLEEHLQTSQFCSVPRNSILEAVSIFREAIAQTEMTDTLLCVLTLDFQDAFDRISHKYLFQILHNYGINPRFIERIKNLYENTTATVQINGTMAWPIPNRSAVRQGCPLSTLLYALFLHPLLRMLEENLSGITIGHRARRTTVVACAGYVTVFAT
jgi:hypothetical protein